jgi:hypothetical protein
MAILIEQIEMHKLRSSAQQPSQLLVKMRISDGR